MTEDEFWNRPFEAGEVKTCPRAEADARRARIVAQAVDCAADRLAVVEPEHTELLAALRVVSGCGHNALLAHIGRLLR